MARRLSRRIPLYIPSDATDVIEAIERIAERHRWSRNKTIVEILRRSVRSHAGARIERTRS